MRSSSAFLCLRFLKERSALFAETARSQFFAEGCTKVTDNSDSLCGCAILISIIAVPVVPRRNKANLAGF